MWIGQTGAYYGVDAGVSGRRRLSREACSVVPGGKRDHGGPTDRGKQKQWVRTIESSQKWLEDHGESLYSDAAMHNKKYIRYRPFPANLVKEGHFHDAQNTLAPSLQKKQSGLNSSNLSSLPPRTTETCARSFFPRRWW